MISLFEGALVDDGDDGTEGEPGDEVSFGEVAMEKQSLWSGFVNLWEVLGNADENEITTKIWVWMRNVEGRVKQRSNLF